MDMNDCLHVHRPMWTSDLWSVFNQAVENVIRQPSRTLSDCKWAGARCSQGEPLVISSGNSPVTEQDWRRDMKGGWSERVTRRQINKSRGERGQAEEQRSREEWENDEDTTTLYCSPSNKRMCLNLFHYSILRLKLHLCFLLDISFCTKVFVKMCSHIFIVRCFNSEGN